MIKLFNTTDTLFSSNGDKVIIPLRAKVHKEDNGSFRIIVANTPQEGQTNISQENNDLPFEIEASALEG